MIHLLTAEYLDRMMARFLLNYYSNRIKELPRNRFSPGPAWSFYGRPVTGYELIERMARGIDKAVEAYPELETARRRLRNARSQKKTLRFFREEYRLALQRREHPELAR